MPIINDDNVVPVVSSTKHSKSTKEKVKEIKKETIKEQNAVEPITHNEPDTQEGSMYHIPLMHHTLIIT